MEGFKPEPPEESSGEYTREERTEKAVIVLRAAFATAEFCLKEKGRDVAKTYLPVIYKTLVLLNKLDPAKVINPLESWNPDGDLAEDQFNELNLRRKILSNAIGIMTGSGKVRHDLNPDVPQSLE